MNFKPRQGVCSLAPLLVCCLMISKAFSSDPSALRIAQEARQDQAMGELYQKTFPEEGVSYYIARAFAFYWRGEGEQGNQAVDALHSLVTENRKAKQWTEELDWTALRLARMVCLFGRDGTKQPGVMSDVAEAEIKSLLWQWIEERVRLDLVEPGKDWWVWGSENHHLQNWSGMWTALALLAKDQEYSAKKLRDGMDVRAAKSAFDGFFKRWIRNRATRGLFVEVGSPHYTKYSLGVFYNLADFSDDKQLADLAREFLDLFWAQYALEQIEGSRGGSRHRSKAGSPSIIGGEVGAAWFHFGLGSMINVHPAFLAFATTNYVPDPLIAEIVGKRSALGEYEILTRLPGRLDKSVWAREGQSAKPVQYTDKTQPTPYTKEKIAVLDPECAATLRKTYAAPGFILGSTMEPAEPHHRWAGFSTSYRWDGVLFSGPCTSVHPTTGEGRPRIFFQPKATTKRAHYNAQWCVQDKGVLIVQRLPSEHTDNQRVFFSKDLQRTERDGWIFVEAADAYAALKVVDGSWKWQPDAPEYWAGSYVEGMGDWLVPEKEFTPIILEVVSKDRYENFGAFQAEILKNPVIRGANQVDYASAHYGSGLTLYTDRSKAPAINGKTVNYEPDMAFASPYLNATFGGTLVRLHVFDQQRIFQFR